MRTEAGKRRRMAISRFWSSSEIFTPSIFAA